jgi:hypothetical protein
VRNKEGRTNDGLTRVVDAVANLVIDGADFVFHLVEERRHLGRY